MTPTPITVAGGFTIPDWGVDHLVLADWRTSVLRFQPRDAAGRQPEILRTGYRTAAGVDLGVRLERGAATGFPTAQDDDVLVALLYLARQQGFPDIVRFVPDQLLRIMRWPRNDRYYQRLVAALDRYQKLSATFEHNWYSRSDRAIKLRLVTGIVAQAEVVTRRGRRAAGAVPESHVQWTENFAASLREGNLLPINLKLLFGWRRPGAKQLHRQLNKTWHGGAKPAVYERDLRELACGHLGMTDTKYLKRNFQQIVLEMELKGYLVPLPVDERYRRIRPGVWRTRFELHPEHVAGTKRRAAPRASQTQLGDERLIVAAYHQARFGRQQYAPQSREVEHARELVQQFGIEQVLRVTAAVAQTVKSQGRQDLYFGFAVPYYRRLLESPAATPGFRQEALTASAAADADHDRLQARLSERRQRQSLLLAAWQGATTDQRARYRDSALQRAESETARRRIRESSAAEPVHEILQELARSAREGDSAPHHR